MPLKRRQTAKTSHPKRFLKIPSKTLSGLTNTDNASLSLIESNQQNSNETENSSNEKEKCIPSQISTIVDMRFVFGEQYAKVSFEDQSLKPQWEPVKNIKGVERLILKFQQKKEEEERERNMNELKAQSNYKDNTDQDSKDKMVSIQQKSTSFSVEPPSNTVNYCDSKLKSVKFAQELVNTKIFSNNDNEDNFSRASTLTIETRLESINKSSPIKSALRRISDKQSETKINENQNKLLQWNGILLKGKTREFSAKVIVKALKEGPNYKPISNKLGSNNSVCMVNTVPLSYALFLIGKEKEPDDIFIMECESGNLKKEQNYMKFHELVAFIQLENDYNGLHLFMFADYRWVCKNLHIDQESLLLVAKNVKIKQKYLLVQQSSIQLLDNEITCDADYYKAKTELLTSGYNNIVTKLSEQKPNFTVYARPKLGETDSIIAMMKALGANYFPDYDCDNMDLVLVHVLMLDQINFMPNLTKLKHQEQCRFFVYGWDFKQQDPIKFEEYFVSGGILSVTTRVLLEEKNGLQRILDVVEYQNEKDANWKVLMDPEIKYNNYNLDALINPNLSDNNSLDEGSHVINSHNIDYFDIFLWRKLKKPNDNNISRLYCALLFSYSFKVNSNKPPRHCILIAQNEEMPFCPKIPGVDVVTLKNFEDAFGFDDNMEWNE